MICIIKKYKQLTYDILFKYTVTLLKNRSYFFIQYKASLVHMHYDIRVTKQTHTHNTYMIYMIMHMHIYIYI